MNRKPLLLTVSAPIICGLFALPCLGQADNVTLHEAQQSVVVHESDGSWELVSNSLHRTVIHARVAAEIDHHWVSSSDYPAHHASQSSFTDALGSGHRIQVQCTGLASQPELDYSIRLYDNLPAGVIEVNLHNATTKSFTVQAIRPVQSEGARPLTTGNSENKDRVLSDSFSEDWPPLKLYDVSQAPHGVFRAVGSQLIYNQASHQSLFFGALRSDRFLTILHWRLNPQDPDASGSYTIDSTGTTEIQATDPESGLKDGPAKNLIELSLPLDPGAAMHAEPVMFTTGQDYYTALDHYGAAIRTLHHSISGDGPMLGWWSWTAFYSGITEGNSLTNAQWLAEHLKKLGYDYFHLDLGYAYARGEYATPNAAQFPEGLTPLTHQVCSLGLKMGFWTAPFEVSNRAWVYEHHKDWLVHNAQGQPISIGVGTEAGREVLYVLDTTNPGAQQYLRSTYRTLTQLWGAHYIKLDFMDNTAIEGYYYRPHTTALEAQRIGLEIIRQAVGDHVLLDKDGSPMLNPVGIVDEGRLSQDTGHTFLRSKEAAPGIAARYYMDHNYFLSDPDAFTVSRELIEERQIRAPLTLSEAQASVALAAVAGGMFEIGDDLPTLGSDPARLALVQNPDLLQMIRLSRAARPLDLMTWQPADEQPSLFLLHEDRRESIFAVFNWTDHPRSHSFTLSGLSLPPQDQYELTDIFNADDRLSVENGGFSVPNQPPHSVRMIRIIDTSVPAQAPSVTPAIPSTGHIDQTLRFSAPSTGVPALDWTWDFGDGVVTHGQDVVHTYTRAGSFTVRLTVGGVDAVPYQGTGTVRIAGSLPLPAPRRLETSRQ